MQRIYIQYLSENDAKRFDSRIIENVQKFGAYKFISDFLSVVKDFVDILMAIGTYLTKDTFYFEKSFELKVSSTKLQTSDFINDIKKKIKSKKEYYKINRQYNELINLFQDSEFRKNALIQKLNNQVISLIRQNEIMNGKINE